jgi:hypothetical protein
VRNDDNIPCYKKFLPNVIELIFRILISVFLLQLRENTPERKSALLICARPPY